MKSLLTISQIEFEKCLIKISSSSLKRLYVEIYEFLASKEKTLFTESILDLERKRSKIQKELQRRRLLTKQSSEEWNEFEKKLHKKIIY